ncbi:MAG TPA: hypothetical protein PK867_15035 [Pirellulales bacterium]|nr:hypothetical protein [Pirellulales bacterium]
MTMIHPNVPDHLRCQVVGYLYDSDDPADLGQTMVEVTTPNGTLITCGWIPEGDPAGKYRVSVTRGFERLLPDYETDDILAAANKLENLVAAVCARKPIAVPASTTIVMKAAGFVGQEKNASKQAFAFA